MKIKYLFKAKKIVDYAQRVSLGLNDQNYKDMINDSRVGVHIANNGEIEIIRDYLGYKCPIRWHDPELNQLVVSIPNEITGNEMFTQLGNELENNIGDKQYTVKEWLELIDKSYGQFRNKIWSPSIMTLKQFPNWRKYLVAEEKLKGWCLNLHIPCYVDKRENGIGSYWECIKHVCELLEFRDSTTLDIVFTEIGCGENNRITQFDLRFIYVLLNEVFGSRVKAFMVYNSAIAMYHNAMYPFKMV